MTYANCTELRQDHPQGVPASHPAYQEKFDRDHDGWACEPSGSGGTKPTPTKTVTTKPTTKPPTAAPTPTKTVTSSPKATPTPSRTKETGTAVGKKDSGDNLPQTGPGEVTAVGAIILMLGAVGVLLFRRRKTRFVA